MKIQLNKLKSKSTAQQEMSKISSAPIQGSDEENDLDEAEQEAAEELEAKLLADELRKGVDKDLKSLKKDKSDKEDKPKDSEDGENADEESDGENADEESDGDSEDSDDDFDLEI